MGLISLFSQDSQRACHTLLKIFEGGGVKRERESIKVRNTISHSSSR